MIRRVEAEQVMSEAEALALWRSDTMPVATWYSIGWNR